MNWREILSGAQHGWCASGLRAVLAPLAFLYAAWMRLRNQRYDSGRATIHRLNVPVIAIGNLTTGGTGKTPFVIWLCTQLIEQGLRPAVISRGYGAVDHQLNDEGREIARRLPGIGQVQNPDRVAAAREAMTSFAADVLVLDDAFQHRRLHRDLDVVLIDATCPWGYGYTLPRGLLREPKEGLRRAQVLVLTRCQAVDDATRTSLKQEALRYAPDAIWIETSHQPTSLVNLQGQSQSLEGLRGKRVWAFCAVGNPQAFLHTLQQSGAEVVGKTIFADHHIFTADDQTQLVQEATKAQVEWLVCTEKDLVKLTEFVPERLELWCLRIDLQIVVGERELRQRLAT